MDSVPTWGLFALGMLTALIAVILTRYTSKLFNGHGIKDVVERANGIIEMYEKHVNALESKVSNLEEQIVCLQQKLDETLQKNEALQKLLIVSPAMQLPPEASK